MSLQVAAHWIKPVLDIHNEIRAPAVNWATSVTAVPCGLTSR
ncbi:hypothetical protein [Halopseudomonas sp.]